MNSLRSRNFIRDIIDADLASGKHRHVATRFPPEPNGYLHIGHAKSICLNFGVARDYGGSCNLRYDDTNPEKEEQEYIDAIERDVRWLGFAWTNKFFASDYFEQLYRYAEDLIRAGKAYVCELTAEEMRATRGTLTEAGTASDWRDRPAGESLDLFRRMRAGEFPNGKYTLRARIDMGSPNINMRDPVLYRIRHVPHHRTGDAWRIYPTYDYTHCISDALEGITHSLCTLEFEDHRPLYDWILDQLDVPCHPQQIEFARLNLEHTVVSKRRLNQLVEQAQVEGWDDPRLPTLAGLRRRGYPAEAIRDFAERIGVTKSEGMVELALLENCVREELDRRAPRALAVLRPLRLVIENYPEGRSEWLDAANHPKDPSFGTRQLPFGRELYVERDDFMENPPKDFHRLAPGREVRLRFAYFVTCREAIRDASGNVVELRCSYDPATRGGNAPDGRKVKGTIHWVAAAQAAEAELRLYDRLFRVPHPAAADDFLTTLNPDSLTVVKGCRVEPALAQAGAEARFQFERLGYFCADMKDHGDGRLVFNRTVGLRDSRAKPAGTAEPR